MELASLWKGFRKLVLFVRPGDHLNILLTQGYCCVRIALTQHSKNLEASVASYFSLLFPVGNCGKLLRNLSDFTYPPVPSTGHVVGHSTNE